MKPFGPLNDTAHNFVVKLNAPVFDPYSSECFNHLFMNMSSRFKNHILFSLTLAIALPQAAAEPTIPVKPLNADSLPAGWTYIPEHIQEIPGGVDDHWWRQFSDPLLDSLIVLGVQNNYDLRGALSRQKIARATMNQAKAGWYPTVGLSTGWTHEQLSGATTRDTPAPVPSDSYFTAGLNASWEIDIFGKVAASVKADRAAYRASRAEYAGVMVSVTAQIASTYFTLRSQQRLLQVARAHCESQMRIVKIAQARFEAMLASKLDVAQAWQTYYSTSASIPALEHSINASITALGILVGEFPAEAAAMLSTPGPLPNWQLGIPAGIPADLLRRRPDIVEAEMELAAAAARIGIAKKDFLPTLTIEGSVGTSARNIGNLFGKHSFSWSVSPTLSWTLFDGFARKYLLVTAREEMQESIDSYNLTVMNAVGETDNALGAYGAALRHIDTVNKLCAENEEVLKLAIERYKNSLSPMTDVVNAQLNALSGESELVQAQASALTSLVSLYEALGGGIYDPAGISDNESSK